MNNSTVVKSNATGLRCQRTDLKTARAAGHLEGDWGEVLGNEGTTKRSYQE